MPIPFHRGSNLELKKSTCLVFAPYVSTVIRAESVLSPIFNQQGCKYFFSLCISYVLP